MTEHATSSTSVHSENCASLKIIPAPCNCPAMTIPPEAGLTGRIGEINHGFGGAWLAYYADWSGMAVFGSEIEALRYAVNKSMSIKFVTYGKDLRTDD